MTLATFRRGKHGGTSRRHMTLATVAALPTMGTTATTATSGRRAPWNEKLRALAEDLIQEDIFKNVLSISKKHKNNINRFIQTFLKSYENVRHS